MADYSNIRLVVLDPVAQQIASCDGNGKNINVLQDHVEKFPDGVFVDRARQAMYGTLMGKGLMKEGTAYGHDGVIWQLDMDGANSQKLVGDGKIRTPKQITSDQKNHKLYFSDREGLRVWRCEKDGGNLELLVETGKCPDDEQDQTKWCVGIAVDPENRKFYWTQKGSPDAGEGKIMRAGYDMPEGETPDNRSDVEVLFENLPEPIDLDLDKHNGFLWWTDRGDLKGGNSVCRAKFTADETVASEHEVVLENLGETIGLAVCHEEGVIFCSSLEGDLFRANLDGSDKQKIAKFASLTGIARL